MEARTRRKGAYIVQLREAGVRGADSKQNSTRLIVPEQSDHCVPVAGDRELRKKEDMERVQCKNTWIAVSDASPSTEHLERCTVSF